MIAADASVAVAAGLPWHERREVAFGAVSGAKVRLPAHAAIETYSVLTRLPPPDRATPVDAAAYLRRMFARPFLALSAAEYEQLLETAAAKGIVGGAIYDALVGATAGRAEATLLTLDRRAVRAYDAVGVDYRLLA